jgi:hypothetical protein
LRSVSTGRIAVKIVDDRGIESLKVLAIPSGGDVDYVLTEHAQDVLKKRQIPIAWMEQALTAPEVTEADPVDADLEHRLARIPEYRRRTIP